ncbi:site-specific integrase [Flavobacterium sp.]|uniref:tyrosine-type recombinase/integrase n=1 Tax=Flavobacterium sp. TaxID=239 RepID=UPI0028BDB882|nr:site-specific integrase [Flavobacterium sp.]
MGLREETDKSLCQKYVKLYGAKKVYFLVLYKKMPNSEKKTSRVKVNAFIDFKPAELRLNKEWLIVYYAKNPITKQLERFRSRVPSMDSKSERLKFAKRIVLEINNKLSNGWSPYLEESGKNFKSFNDVITEFKVGLDKLVADNVLRADTKRTYNSNCNLLEQFVNQQYKITFAIEIKKAFCVQYLEWIYIDRKSSPRTRNNHLIFIKLFCGWLVDKGVLAENPTHGLQPLRIQVKKREVFDPITKERISGYLKSREDGFPVLCKAIYYCLLRNSELRKLQVWMIDKSASTIFIPKEISKNKKDQTITIPANFLQDILVHIANAPNDWYVFSNNNYFAGLKQMSVRKIQNSWDVVRKDLRLDKKFQFYSFKDTGITDLLYNGIPALKVRDQARHQEIRTTEIYTPRIKSADEQIKNSNILL